MKSMKSMKAMRSMKSMKAMRSMKKAKKVSVIAKGKMARASVFSGRKEKTQTGLTKNMLLKNKNGKARFAKSAIKTWADATKAARKALSIKGFCPVGGSTPAGKALYAKVKTLLK